MHRPDFEASLYYLLFIKEKMLSYFNSQALVSSPRNWRGTMNGSLTGWLGDGHELEITHAFAHISCEVAAVCSRRDVTAEKKPDGVLIKLTF